MKTAKVGAQVKFRDVPGMVSCSLVVAMMLASHLGLNFQNRIVALALVSVGVIAGLAGIFRAIPRRRFPFLSIAGALTHGLGLIVLTNLDLFVSH